MALSQDAVQSMLDAMKIISSAQMQNISYDETIVCTIVDNSHAKQQSYYMVTDGSVKFKAYVTSQEDTTKYKVDEQVYVKIPQGDYSQQKIIEGYYVTEKEVVPVTYVSPLDTFLDMANLIEVDGTATEVSGQLIANHATNKQIALWQWSTSKDDASDITDDLQVNGIYDTLGLQASFKCLLDSYKMRQGTYGLRLDLYVRLNPSSDKHITKSIYLDSSEMFGNPYAFTIYATQAKTFDITQIGTIDGMTLWFYQNQDFTYFDGKIEQTVPISEIANIFVKDVYIAFGSELSKVEDNKIRLYSTENQSFNYKQPGDATNQKHLGFLWYNKTEDSDYIGFSDGIVDFVRNADGEIIEPKTIDHYDEWEYLALSHEDSRLVEQMGKDVPDDQNGLDVAASVEEAKTVFEKLTKTIQVNLVNTLSDFYQRTKSLSLEIDGEDGPVSANDYFNKDETGKIQIASAYGTYVEEAYKALLTWYNSALKAASAIQTHQKNQTTPVEKGERDKVVKYNNTTKKWETTTSWIDDDDKPQSKVVSSKSYNTIYNSLKPDLLEKFYTYITITDDDGNEVQKPEFILNELRINIADKYNGFQDIYDTYSKRLIDILNDIEAYFEELNTILRYDDNGTIRGKERLITSSNKESDKDSSSFKYTLNKTITTYTQRDFSHMANRYCIYWYRYVQGHKDEEGLMDDGWQRLKTGDEIVCTCNETGAKFIMADNIGLPSEYAEEGGVYYFAPKAASGEGFVKAYLDPESKEEKFKVVLYYNHERFESNELTFTNLHADEIPDKSTMDSTDAIYIEHDTNSMETYQTLYASNNSLTNKTHSSVNRKLKLRYEGTLGGDENLAGAQVFWYLPRNVTMLTANVSRLTTARDSTNDDEKFTAFSTDFYRTAKAKKKTTVRRGPATTYGAAQKEEIKTNTKEDGTTEEVKTKVDITYKKNDILQSVYDQQDGWYSLKSSCAIGASGQWVNGDDIEIIDNAETYMDGYSCFYKTIGFSKVSEEITDEEGNVQTVEKDVIYPEDVIFEYRIKEYYEPTQLNNTIFCIVKKDNYKFETSITMLFGTQGTSGTDYTILVRPDDNSRAVTNSEILPLLIKAYNYDNEEIPIKTNTAELTDGSLYKPQIKWRGPSTMYLAFADEASGNIVNSAEASVYQEGISFKAFASPKTNNACGIAQVSVSMYDSTYGEGAKELSVLYPIAWSAGDYLIQGATSVVYDSSGGNPAYFKDPYRIYDATTNAEITKVRWDIKYFMQAAAQNTTPNPVAPKYMFYFQNDVLQGYDISGEEPVAITSGSIFDEMNFYAGYVPRLNQANKLTPCNTYISSESGVDLNVYPVVQCYDESNSLIWAQPVAITQNRYPNSMLNHWDGKFQIDEESGTILSTMVSAGFKNTDNTYSGVLMGQLDCDNADNHSDVGVYGFHHGAQSFGLNIDGTAFFGKSGHGRIIFDGNSGSISSASYQANRPSDSGYGDQSVSAAGMMIDLDDGFIDMQGTTKIRNDDGSYSYTPEKMTGANDNEVAQAHIHIDVKSPYFTIRSNTQMDKNKHIIHIANDKYYLQSDNYIPGTFSLIDGVTVNEEGYLIKKSGETTIYVNENGIEVSADKKQLGTGFGSFFDLQNGRFDAYNLFLTSKNIYINSQQGTNHPYFIIKDDDGYNLFYAGHNRSGDAIYYLKSWDYNPGTAGTKFDLMTGQIDSYNFTLTSGDLIRISSTSPYVKISDMLYMGTDAYYLQSNGYKDEEAGIRINFNKTDTNRPLTIGSNFKVTWDGNTTVNNFTATYGKIGNWTISEGNLVSGDGKVVLAGSGGAISGSAISGGSLTGSAISGGSINVPNATSPTFKVTSEGVLTATGATLTTLTVHGAAKFTQSATVHIEGPLGINTAPVATYDLKVNGKSYLIGNIGIGTTPSTTYGLYVSGKTYLGGNIGIRTAADDTYYLKIGGKTYVGGQLHITANTGIGCDADTSYTLKVDGTTNITGNTTIDGVLTVPTGTSIMIGSGDSAQSLLDYVEENASLLDFNFEGISITTLFGDNAVAKTLGNSEKDLYDVGNAGSNSAIATPVYFAGGKPVACDLSVSYALKGHSHSEYVKKSDLANKGSASNPVYFDSNGNAQSGYSVYNYSSHTHSCYVEIGTTKYTVQFN